ncbi:MAG: AI-2E family transporter, partial [Clostridium sp.]
MFWQKLKYKDIIITTVLIIIISTIGIKVIENFPYFFDIVEKVLALLTPFVYGLIIAYILNPLVNLFEKKAKLNNGMAIALTYTVLVGTVSLIGVFFIPSIIESALEIAKSVPDYITEMQKWFYEFLNKEEIKGFMASTGTFDNINTILTQFGTMIISILEGSVTQVFSFSSQVVKFLIGILISIYVLIDKKRFIRMSKRLTFITFKEKNAEKLIECVRIYHKMICAYIGIKAIDSAIIGAIAFILLEIVNSEYAVLLAVIVAIT